VPLVRQGDGILDASPASIFDMSLASSGPACCSRGPRARSCLRGRLMFMSRPQILGRPRIWAPEQPVPLYVAHGSLRQYSGFGRLLVALCLDLAQTAVPGLISGVVLAQAFGALHMIKLRIVLLDSLVP